ncbi:PDZ and LIM domain protein 1 [Holothuria leucospilota]|uniref:PDZ and LIM domain protein 1 n=1 Tax=Holothuria leucospilota TaxID=206669 RepID=A0A9Q1BCB2_HOLLE|nr:PDZ and LIM domain protein 1 [Holothuria leucospilota]
MICTARLIHSVMVGPTDRRAELANYTIDLIGLRVHNALSGLSEFCKSGLCLVSKPHSSTLNPLCAAFLESNITAGGKAQQANLREKDVILMINGQDIATCTHLDAQNKIKASFHDDLHLRTQRGDSRVWNPVTRDESGGYRVSLKANQPDQEFLHPGSKSNFAPKGYGSPQPAAPSSVPPPGGRGSAQVVHLQFNSPAGLYSEQNIAETFKGQTAGMIDNSVGNGDYQPQPYQPLRDTGYGPKPGEVSATMIETSDGEEIKYSGYINPGAQSRSFKMLQDMLDYEDNSKVSTETTSDEGGAEIFQAHHLDTNKVEL